MTRLKHGQEWPEVIDDKLLFHFPLDQDNDERWRDIYHEQAVAQGVPASIVGSDLVVRLPTGTTPTEGLAVLHLAEVLVELTDSRRRLERARRSPQEVAHEMLEKWRHEHHDGPGTINLNGAPAETSTSEVHELR